MAMVDRDKAPRDTKEGMQKLPAFLRYPADRVDFGYEIMTSAFSTTTRRPGPEGLSLVARVYE